MSRFHSLIIHVTDTALRIRLDNLQECDGFLLEGEWFSPAAEEVSFYDFVWNADSGRLCGIELHTSRSTECIFESKSCFQNVGPIPAFDCCWRLLFPKCIETEVENRWDQFCTENPYISSGGSLVLIIQVWHLDELEYRQIVSLVETP